ncbi:hypothetical protein ACWGN5_35360 [Streptomyces sp. NPDC055815]
MSPDLHTATSDRRAAVIDLLQADSVLADPVLRNALLRVPPREAPPPRPCPGQGPGADPIDWRLLDDREE